MRDGADRAVDGAKAWDQRQFDQRQRGKKGHAEADRGLPQQETARWFSPNAQAIASNANTPNADCN